MSRQIINTEKAPAAIGPYSQAVRAGNTVYFSGQIPLDPATGDIVGAGDVEAQPAAPSTTSRPWPKPQVVRWTRSCAWACT